MKSFPATRCLEPLSDDAETVRAEIADLEAELAQLPRPRFDSLDGDDGGSELRAQIEMLEIKLENWTVSSNPLENLMDPG
jgi:hypothetical protein